MRSVLDPVSKSSSRRLKPIGYSPARRDLASEESGARMRRCEDQLLDCTTAVKQNRAVECACVKCRLPVGVRLVKRRVCIGSSGEGGGGGAHGQQVRQVRPGCRLPECDEQREQRCWVTVALRCEEVRDVAGGKIQSTIVRPQDRHQTHLTSNAHEIPYCTICRAGIVARLS